jgi:RNA polymerase sigma-70 factor (ECF subfamily)
VSADWSALPEAKLVELVRAGEEAAFEALLKRYQGKIYRLALSVTKSREDAEEVLQDVFLSVYRKIASFDGRSAFGTWLYRIAVNAALMKLRGREPAHESLDAYLPQFAGGRHARMLADWTDRADEVILRKERAQFVRQAIETLPPEYRVVLLLRDLEGLSNLEVAEVLGTTVPAVKARLHRARLALRGMLEASVTGLRPGR